MRKALLILLIIICTHFESSAILNTGANKYEITFAPGTNYYLTIDEFLKLKPQANIKTSKRKSKKINKLIFKNADKKAFKWHWGGFFRGLLLPFGIGMIISSLKKNERKKDRVTSAAIGTLITSIVILFLALSSW